MDSEPTSCFALLSGADVAADAGWRDRFPDWPSELPAASQIRGAAGWTLLVGEQAWRVIARDLGEKILLEARPAVPASEAELGHLLRTLAHDFNNQLHVISNIVETLQMELELEPADAVLLEDLAAAAVEAMAQTEDVGLLGRALTFGLEPVELSEAVDGVLDQLAMVAVGIDGPEVRLVSEPDAPVDALAHPRLLEHALQSLLQHLHAAAGGDVVELAVQRADDGSPELVLALVAGDLRAAVAPELLEPETGERDPFSRRRFKLDLLRRALAGLQVDVELIDLPRPSLRLRFLPAP